MIDLGDSWIDLSENISFTFFILAIINLLVYFIKLMIKGNSSAKYSFAAHSEVKALSRGSKLISLAIFFLLFAMIANAFGRAQFYEFIFVGFISFMISFMIGYGFSTYIQYYYPFILEKRLRNIRFKRLKSTSGNSMRLMNELEEDEFLTNEMIALEDASEADFDVWIDEVTGEKVIQKYDMSEKALICHRCNFRTLKERNEKVILEATEHENGKVEKSYNCTYCNLKEVREGSTLSLSKKRELALL